MEPANATEATASQDELAKLVITLRSEIAQVQHERDEYKRLAALFEAELKRLKDLQKTPREHVDAGEIQLLLEGITRELLANKSHEATAAQDSGDNKEDKKPKRKLTPHGRSVLPEHLPVETVIVKPTHVPEAAVVVGEEVTWRLGFRPGGFYRLKIVRPTFAVPRDSAAQCSGIEVEWRKADPAAGAVIVQAAPEAAADEQGNKLGIPASEAVASVEIEPAPASGPARERTIVTAEMPHEMIPRGLPTADLLAHTIGSKFADKLPFNRQTGMYARQGVSISRGTMCGWLEQSHALAGGVVTAMEHESRTQAHCIATDATGVLVQANERCKKGHFWVLVADRDHVLFRYSIRHSSDEPKRFLRGFQGTVLADASSVYDALYAQPDGPDEAGCWSHARRYFFKAISSDRERALVGLGLCNLLFDIEREIAALAPAKKKELRRQRSSPIVDKLKQWRDTELTSDEVGAGTPIRRALGYLRNHWDALTRFLEDGRLPIHNNRSELELRRLVIGRANWLFVGSDESAEWTCTFVSLIASAELHGLDPLAYLRDLFRVLPGWPQKRLLELAPKYWVATRARLRLDELSLPFGPLTVPPPLPAAE